MNIETKSPMISPDEINPDEKEKVMSNTTIEKFLEQRVEDRQNADQLTEELKKIEGSTWEERLNKIKDFIKLNIHEYITGVAFIAVTAAYQLKPMKKLTPEQKKDRENFKKITTPV